MASKPLLTVVFIAGNRRERVQRSLRGLLSQDIADQIVIMLFDRADKPSRDLPELTSPNVIYQAVDRNTTVGQLQKRGVVTASSDCVAFIEEHVVVPPGWARETLRLHALGYAGVTGIFHSGNSQYSCSRILFSITYGEYILSKNAGETAHVPSHNSSFIRSKLLKFSDDLAMFLSTDILMMRCLIENGEKCYRADLHIKHWNHNNWLDGWSALRCWSQMYICNRLTTERWWHGQRLLRMVAVPFIPFVRGYQNYKQARANGINVKQFFSDLPSILFLHCGSAIGIASGLLFGYQDCERRFADCESNDQRSD